MAVLLYRWEFKNTEVEFLKVSEKNWSPGLNDIGARKSWDFLILTVSASTAESKGTYLKAVIRKRTWDFAIRIWHTIMVYCPFLLCYSPHFLLQFNRSLSMLGQMFSIRQIDDNFSYFSQNTVFEMSCKLSPMVTICMKSQILFSVEKKKKYQFIVC